MTTEKPMVSYWTNVTEVYQDEQGFTLITGNYTYDDLEKQLAVHWSGFSNSRGYLVPCRLPTKIANALLSGLIDEASKSGHQNELAKLQAAYRLINE